MQLSIFLNVFPSKCHELGLPYSIYRVLLLLSILRESITWELTQDFDKMTTSQLSASDVDSYDYLVVGGGTAGCVMASRLAEYLPNKRILLIEAGPSDYMDNRVIDLKNWLNLLGGELDYDYGTTEQPMGRYSDSNRD